jgi:urease accessory protein
VSGAPDVRPLLTALQLGDSFFPSGSTSQSWGLEELRGGKRIDDAQALDDFLTGQLEGRWATADRVAAVAAHAAAASALDDVAAVDDEVERSTPVAGWRVASRRGGRALLAAHTQLGTPGAADYAARVERGEAPGHGCVAHGLVAAGSGLSAEEAAALSGYGVAMAIVSAGLRLGIVGHREAQRLLAGQRERIARLVAAPVPPLEEMSAWVPAAEIAAMRHEARRGRLFAS